MDCLDGYGWKMDDTQDTGNGEKSWDGKEAKEWLNEK